MLRYFFIFALQIYTLSSYAENTACNCMPLPESKKYIGEARQTEDFGYRIHWTCDYNCSVQSSGQELRKTLRAEYNQKYYGAENGKEGICEGMIYVPEFNVGLNREIYMWRGQLQYFNPRTSTSPGLKIWAKNNNCRGGGWFD